MRKTAPQVVTELYKILKTSVVNTSVTSNIFKYERTLNFKGECIVINTLPLTTEQLQKGVANVNYFVPNIKNTTVNPVDETQPNSARLEAGAKIIDELLKEYWGDNYVFEITQSIPTANDVNKEWYINFRINYRNINI